MTLDHPLDRPVWTALTTRQSAFALGDARAVRIDPAMGVFAAAADDRPTAAAALAALVAVHPGAGFLEREDGPMAAVLPAGIAVASRWPCLQMIAPALTPGGPDLACEPLSDADAPEMLALATLTRPGPFRARTHQLGDFIGIRHEGRLIAMAGQRLRVDGFTEVSGVCTHPDHRGRGHAAGLMRIVMARILQAGEMPFLHARAENAGTIALYASLGFEGRARIAYTVLAG